MTTLGTPLSPSATKVMLLGSGELGKEVLIALQRLGVETIAVDRYDNAPGQQVAHHARTITMSDPAQLEALIEAERRLLVVPEIEGRSGELWIDPDDRFVSAAAEALRLGAIERVVPRERLRDEALAVAAKIAAKSPAMIRIAKEALTGIEDGNLEAKYRWEQGFTLQAYTSPDSAETRRAFVEKRDATF